MIGEVKSLSTEIKFLGTEVKSLKTEVKSLGSRMDNVELEVRSLGVGMEELHDDVKLLAEQQTDMRSDISQIKSTLEDHTEMIGNLAVDMTIVKNKLENKVDRSEFKALDSRVARLEL